MVRYYSTQPSDQIYTLDLVNAVTTPVNLNARDTGTLSFRGLSRTQSVIRASTQLIGAYSLI